MGQNQIKLTFISRLIMIDTHFFHFSDYLSDQAYLLYMYHICHILISMSHQAYISNQNCSRNSAKSKILCSPINYSSFKSSTKIEVLPIVYSILSLNLSQLIYAYFERCWHKLRYTSGSNSGMSKLIRKFQKSSASITPFWLTSKSWKMFAKQNLNSSSSLLLYSSILILSMVQNKSKQSYLSLVLGFIPNSLLALLWCSNDNFFKLSYNLS